MRTSKISTRLIDFLLKYDVISDGDEEHYRFGIEVIKSSTITASVVIATSVILGEFLLGIQFIIVFAYLRTWVGGFHAKSIMACTVLTNLLFLLSFIISQKIIWEAGILAVITFFATILLVGKLVKKVEGNEVYRFSRDRRKAIQRTLCTSTLINGSLVFNINFVDVGFLVFCFLSICVLSLIDYREEEQNEESSIVA